MMTALMMFLAAVCVLAPLIALHEWGHYIVARLCGVKVLTYSIGFGKRVFGWTSKKTGIDYRICAIPLGGYVKMLDEREGNVDERERHLAFNNQHPLKKIAIVAAGPLMNFVIAIVLFFVLFLQPSEQLNTRIGKVVENSPASASLVVGDKITAINGKNITTWEELNYALASHLGESTTLQVTVERDGKYSQKSVVVDNFMQDDAEQSAITSFGVLSYQPMIEPVLAEVVPDGAAALMGLKAGDKVLAIDGRAIENWLDAIEIIRNSPEKMLNFQVDRDQETLDIQVMPRGVKSGKKTIGQIGVRVAQSQIRIPDDYKMSIHHTPSQALNKAFAKTYDLSKMTLDAIKKMFTGVIGTEHISGPITIAEVSKVSFEIGWQQVLSTAAMISLSLAVMNLLPVPMLDGGHLVFYTYELIRGKAVAESVQMAGLKIGMVLLLCFMILAISNDIMRIFG